MALVLFGSLLAQVLGAALSPSWGNWTPLFQGRLNCPSLPSGVDKGTLTMCRLAFHQGQVQTLQPSAWHQAAAHPSEAMALRRPWSVRFASISLEMLEPDSAAQPKEGGQSKPALGEAGSDERGRPPEEGKCNGATGRVSPTLCALSHHCQAAAAAAAAMFAPIPRQANHPPQPGLLLEVLLKAAL